MDDVIRQFKDVYGNFNDAFVEGVDISEPGSIVLTIQPAARLGEEPGSRPALTILFEHVKDPDGIAARFRDFPSQETELGYLGLDPQSEGWKSGMHRFRLAAERRDIEFTFCCAHVVITEERDA